MATKKQIQDLGSALIRAREKAFQFSEHEDGGTCNLDTPQIFLKGWSDEDVRLAFEVAGLRFNIQRAVAMIVVDILGCTSGQGNRRTMMAEAVRNSLRTDGYESHVYYMMD